MHVTVCCRRQGPSHPPAPARWWHQDRDWNLPNPPSLPACNPGSAPTADAQSGAGALAGDPSEAMAGGLAGLSRQEEGQGAMPADGYTRRERGSGAGGITDAGHMAEGAW